MNEAPSRSRSQLDAVYAALSPDRDVPLARVVEASGADREVVRRALQAAAVGDAAHGVNGRWTRGRGSRTQFRDRTVFGAVTAAGDDATTFEQLLEVVPVSRPQLYTTLARLQVAGLVLAVRDGSRTPRYVSARAESAA